MIADVAYGMVPLHELDSADREKAATLFDAFGRHYEDDAGRFAEVALALTGLENADPMALIRAAQLFDALATHYRDVAEAQIDKMAADTQGVA